MPAVVGEGLVKSVGEGRAARRILDGAEVAVETGELVAVLGRSGSGKSTLLHLLGGLDRPDAGAVEIAGRRLNGSERRVTELRRRHVGFVFQFFHLIPELSGEENVMLPARLPGARRGAARRAAELIDRLELRDVARQAPHELSGGEQQRFAIARALVNDPEVVLADEPTGNLDDESARAVHELLRGIADAGKAVVVVTHDPGTTAAADRVLHLRGGRLAP